ncbi:hypothetical protein SKAU_G00004750 [Synaphobranchus kaupii]|uniref:TNFR-Cys domain-containing protein n=1 Tax=Synaphobranchus kaupii TaxID=118154 RepID=A0A9Q1GAJ8_SYNKA|nr:hypothetical protein SKAU_G00004750 [Synaphobranchus kaupii]
MTMCRHVCRMVLFTLCIVFTIGKECGPAEYKTDAEECCPMCEKGYVVGKDCTSDSSTICMPCINGTYMDKPNGLSKCRQCQTCDTRHGLIFLHECTTTSNASCDVKDGFYCKSYSKNECNLALKHSPCTHGRYPKVPGTKTADTLCEECPDGYFSTNGINCTAWTKDEKPIKGSHTRNSGAPHERILHNRTSCLRGHTSQWARRC